MLKLSAKIWLILIILLVLLTRLYKIGDIPASLYWDEASIAYNAYSILQTGRDEWGDLLPLHFRAFGEFKLPVYIYATAVSAAVFGLSELSVRLPSVFFAVGIVILTYLLSLRIFRKEDIALFSAFFISVSQWFFIFSRTGYEAVAGLMFFLLGLYIFTFTSKNIIFVLLGTLSFIISIYSYNSLRIIVPVTIPFLLFSFYGKLYKKKLFSLLLVSVIVVAVLAVSFIPIVRVNLYDTAIARNRIISIFTNSDGFFEISTKFIRNYSSHFSLGFLLFDGDSNLRSQQPGFGQMSAIEIILSSLGIFYLISRKYDRNEPLPAASSGVSHKSGTSSFERSSSRSKLRGILAQNKVIAYLPLLMILLAPVPASITTESPHALRSVIVVPFLAMLAGLGVNFLIERFNKFPVRETIILILLSFFAFYLYNFFNFYPISSSAWWQYGYKEIFTGYRKDFKNFEKIIISDEYGQPYIFALFYLNYPPQRFVVEAERQPINDWGFSTVSKFNKFEFRKIKTEGEETKNSLIFASEKEVLSGLEPYSEVKFLNGKTAFWVYEL